MYVARQDEVHMVAHQQRLVCLMETLNLLEVTCTVVAAAAAAVAAAAAGAGAGHVSPSHYYDTG
jgi:hypothetical protein